MSFEFGSGAELLIWMHWPKSSLLSSVEDHSSSSSQEDVGAVPAGAYFLSPDAWDVGTGCHHVGGMNQGSERLV